MFEPEDAELAQFFDDAPYLETGCADCPPPLFLLPPPPRPPHLPEEACPLVSAFDTCDNILLLGGQVSVFTSYPVPVPSKTVGSFVYPPTKVADPHLFYQGCGPGFAWIRINWALQDLNPQ